MIANPTNACSGFALTAAGIQFKIKMRKLKIAIVILLLSFGLSNCAFQREADQKFGDQHFKTSIALIELHKVRFGEYPSSLKELKFVGEWDQIALASVNYKKVANGYELDVVKGWVGKPQLTYPDEFWKGLGVVRSNMKP
jgi:hypothetical protein